MSTEPLAEAYEKLKELRRQGELPKGELLEQATSRLLNRVDALEIRIRLLQIKPLADRVFGNEQKAETWLNRPNPSFSGQKPIDLLKDELGTAVVREALERIDHGIFS